MTGGRVLVASLLIGLPPGAPAPAKGEPARTVALALSGGGARGIAHIGVLRALEENQIPVDFIAGTSMGAVIGAFYASGYSAEEIARIVRGIDWQSIFSGKPERSLVPLSARLGETPRILSVGYDFFRLALPESALADYPIHRVLTRYLAGPSLAAGGDFDRLPIPFRAVAADLRTGSRVVHARGDLARAVRSSMSIPLAFSPVRLGDQVLVDGGIVDNLPVDVACGLGADFVLAVDVTSPPLPPERYRDLLGIASQLTDILAASANRNHQERANLLLRPELHGHRFTDYSNFESLIESGYQAAMAEMPSLLDLVAQRPAGERRAAAGLAGRRLTAVWVEGERHIA
jgi:NTE family protein